MEAPSSLGVAKHPQEEEEFGPGVGALWSHHFHRSQRPSGHQWQYPHLQLLAGLSRNKRPTGY